MKKNEFLDGVVAEFLDSHVQWKRVHNDRKGHYQVVGRVLGPEVFVFLDFSARSDRPVFGQAVGWSKTLDTFQSYLNRTTNAPDRERDGRLKKLLTLDNPRDFQYVDMHISTSSLCRPFGGFNAQELSLEQIKAGMLQEVEEYALPYLCLMLKHRHGVVVTPEELGSSELTVE